MVELSLDTEEPVHDAQAKPNQANDAQEPCPYYLLGHCRGMNKGICKKDHSMKLCLLPRTECGKACEGQRHPRDCYQHLDLGWCGWLRCSYRHGQAAGPCRGPEPRDGRHMVLLAATGSQRVDSGISEQEEIVNLFKDLQNKMDIQQQTFEEKMADFDVQMDTKLNEV